MYWKGGPLMQVVGVALIIELCDHNNNNNYYYYYTFRKNLYFSNLEDFNLVFDTMSS